MAFSAGGGGDEKPMAEINTTPMVDVMLVLLIIFMIAVPVALQTVEDLKIPIFKSLEADNKVENLLLTVSSTDVAGLSPSLVDTAFSGAARSGRCRVFFNSVTPVDSSELYKSAFERLDAIVKRAGGAEAMMANPELIPQVHIRGDVNVPWRCVAGTIYNVQAAGYPTIGFISNAVDPKG